MRKKILHKRSSPSPDTSLESKKFPLESVKALQSQFEIAGNEYPGLAHVLMLRSESKCDEQLDDKALIFDEKALKAEFEALDEKLQQKFGTFQDFASYKRMARGRFPFESARPGSGVRIVMSDPASSSNLCQVWHYGSGLEYKVGMSWVHFLCHRRGECWNKGRATERFLTLVELTGGLLAEPTIVNHLGVSQEMQHLTYAIDRWLVALHECGFAKIYDSMSPENLMYMMTDLLLPITSGFLRSGRCAYLGAVPDVWIASSLLCAGILDLAGKQTEGRGGVLEMKGPRKGRDRKTKPTQSPMALREFMREHCQSLSDNLLDSRAKALQRLAQRNQIELKDTGQWKRGQSKKYLPQYLIENWPVYEQKLQTLPSLKNLSLS